jgi:iron complex outermembrane receptor protein
VQYTDEVQGQGKFIDGKLNVTLGGFASYQDYPNPGPNCNGNRIFGGLPNCTTNLSITRSQGLFGQATLNLGAFSESLEDFNFTAGYRRNWDYTKQKTKTTSRAGVCATAASPDNRDVFNPTTCFAVLSNSEKSPGWTFNLDWRFDPGKMVYGTISRAYSGGGFNSINLPVSLRVYGPQYNTNYELGVKADWDLGGSRLRTNVSAFYDRFNNIQEAVTGSYVDALGATRITGVTLNAAAARIIGTEVNVQWSIGDFDVTANYVYTDAKYLSYNSRDPSSGAPITLVNNKFEFHADHIASATLRYNLPVDQSMGNMSVAASGTISSQETGLDDSLPGRPTPVAPFKRSRLDARADWTGMYGRPFDLSLALTNVTNHRYSIIGFNLYQTLGIITTQYAEPRMFSARLRWHF